MLGAYEALLYQGCIANRGLGVLLLVQLSPHLPYYTWRCAAGSALFMSVSDKPVCN